VTPTVDTGWTAVRAVPAAAPMRAVDRWRSAPTGDGFSVTARLRIDAGDPNLRGHFPGLPVLPGVFVVEALCQAMALAAEGARLRAIGSVRFLAPLLAGDELTLHADAVAAPDGWRVTAQGRRADGTLAARIRAEFTAGSTAGSTAEPVAGPAVESAGDEVSRGA
jgi:3-hydroxyacyl-[acyl-carrier-protein] dehydratase